MKEVCVICGSREEFILFMDNMMFFATKENPSATFKEDEEQNPIINGVRYTHGHEPRDLRKKPYDLYLFTGAYQERRDAGDLYNIAYNRTKVYGGIKEMKLPLIKKLKGEI